jgi:hypothetical protein
MPISRPGGSGCINDNMKDFETYNGHAKDHGLKFQGNLNLCCPIPTPHRPLVAVKIISGAHAMTVDPRTHRGCLSQRLVCNPWAVLGSRGRLHNVVAVKIGGGAGNLDYLSRVASAPVCVRG